MAQKLYCPMCNKLLIENYDLVTDRKVYFDMAKLKQVDEDLVSHIKCDNCKRRIRYYIDR